MTRGAAVHHFLNEHGLRAVAQTVGDVDQLSSLHQHFELRNEQPVDVSVVDDAHEPIAEMMAERGVYVKKRQADNVRARRFSSIDTHTEIPRPRLARADKNTVATDARLFCEPERAEIFLALGGIVSAPNQTTVVLT